MSTENDSKKEETKTLSQDAVMRRFIHFKFKNNMKIQELRIGNLIKYKKGHLSKIIGTHLIEDKEIIEVVGVDDGYIDGTFELNNFYPVELTDRMLFNIGFIHRYNVSKKINEYYLNGILITRSNSGNFYYNKMLINLHKLQNLYFALRGVELELSSNVA